MSATIASAAAEATPAQGALESAGAGITGGKMVKLHSGAFTLMLLW